MQSQSMIHPAGIGRQWLEGTTPCRHGHVDPLLREFTVSNNQLMGPLPTTIGQWVDLQVFEVDSNQLSGSLPTTMASWTSQSLCSIFNNNFTGPLSSSAGAWTSLNIVSASFNAFTGSLPPDVGKWTNLQIKQQVQWYPTHQYWIVAKTQGLFHLHECVKRCTAFQYWSMDRSCLV
jgi:hypothetical protein